ncbi:MAG: hypothetical protein ACMG6S_36785 [Byssovorax sp.]
MRIRIAALFYGCVTLTAPRAWAQAPGQLPPTPPGMTAGPTTPPVPPVYPPPASPAPGPPQSPAFAPPSPTVPPASPPQAQPPPEAAPIQVAGRVGFGVGLHVAPGVGSPSADLSAISIFGASLGIRWWAKERLAVIPSLSLSISHTSAPSTTNALGDPIQADSFTNGTVAPALSLGYAAYRGKSTRFLVIGGVGFGYEARQRLQGAPATYETAKSLSFTVPFGFALEQFFTSRISVVVGAQAPLFEYRSTKFGYADALTTVGANFNATQLNASIFFYTD